MAVLEKKGRGDRTHLRTAMTGILSTLDRFVIAATEAAAASSTNGGADVSGNPHDKTLQTAAGTLVLDRVGTSPERMRWRDRPQQCRIKGPRPDCKVRVALFVGGEERADGLLRDAVPFEEDGPDTGIDDMASSWR